MTRFGFDAGALYALSLALLVSTLVLAALVRLASPAAETGAGRGRCRTGNCEGVRHPREC